MYPCAMEVDIVTWQNQLFGCDVGAQDFEFMFIVQRGLERENDFVIDVGDNS